MAVVIATDPYRRTYYSRCCTTATWFCVAIYILIFLVPFLLSNIQHNLWRSRFEVLDTGSINFQGNIALIAKAEGFSVFDQFLPTMSNNQFSSATLLSEIGSIKSDTVKFTLRVLTTSTSFSGNLYVFLNYNSNSTDLKYINFTDIMVLPITVLPTQNFIRVTGTYYLDQRQQFNISKAVAQTYSVDAFEEYKKSKNILNVLNAFSNNDFKIGTSVFSYSSQSFVKGFEVSVSLERSFRKIKVSPSVASVLRNSWPIYLGLFIPIAIALRFVLKEAYLYQLFQTSSTVKFGDTEIHRIF